MATTDQLYKKLVHDVLLMGNKRPSRVGATRSLPGLQIAFPHISIAFPLLTSRKIYTKGIFGELAAFLEGAEDLATFEKYGCPYWRYNASQWGRNEGKPSEEWQVGRIYGNTWRNWPAVSSRYQPTPKMRTDLPKTFLNVGNGHGAPNHPLLKTWQGMMTRCYNPEYAGYKYYGGRGVFVEDRWLAFIDFAADAEQLPGYIEKVQSTNSHDYQLDKDTLGDGFCYSRKTCAWITSLENNPWQAQRQYTVQSKEGRVYTFTNPHQFCLEHNLENKNFCDLWTGRKNAKTRYGYTLLDVTDLPHKPRSIDQLKILIEGLRNDPYSRRHILTTWNPDLLDQACLPPCHILTQFYITSNTLDCIVYMRSVDIALGLPSDMVLYGALLILIARHLKLVPGKLIFQFGDAHIYEKHIPTLWQQLDREDIIATPQVDLNKGADLFTFKPEDLTVYNYQPHSPLSYELL